MLKILQQFRGLKMMVTKKMVINFYLDRKCVNFNYELRSGTFNDCFYFWFIITTSVATSVILNWIYECFYKCWLAALNALAWDVEAVSFQPLPLPLTKNDR